MHFPKGPYNIYSHLTKDSYKQNQLNQGNRHEKKLLTFEFFSKEGGGLNPNPKVLYFSVFEMTLIQKNYTKNYN